MLRFIALLLCLYTLDVPAPAQTSAYPYYLKTFAGTFPLGDGGPAASALLFYPYAAIPDAAGNLYILDSSNFRIRKVDAGGTITTFAQLNIYGYDMKMAPDGSFYVAGDGAVVKVNAAGLSSVFAGTGTNGYGGDGGAATSALVGTAYGIALDASGNVYFSDTFYPSMRVRRVTTDGKIATVAGNSTAGFNGDFQPATSASLYYPGGVAVDAAGNVYVADYSNSRIRKFTVGGNITTVAGNGSFGPPADGSAAGPLGYPNGLWVDSASNLYATDVAYGVIVKVTPAGSITRIAGNYDYYSSPADGIATTASLMSPQNVAVDKAGNILVSDWSHRVRKITPDGMLATVAGRIHFAGDGGPAVSALLNQPQDVALDAQGNVLIGDGNNYRIRKVTPNGTIASYAGNGKPASSSGLASIGSSLPYVYAMASDQQGAIYLATYYQAFKIATDGTVSVVAGNGSFGNSGDGGPATDAKFGGITGIAVDSTGNVYLADGTADRVRMVAAATGIVSGFAGTGTRGRSGDGALATSAMLNLTFRSPLAVDQKGNVYIADGGNRVIRKVSGGLISTVVGNGSLGDPDGVSAITAPLSAASGLAVDTAGNLYIASDTLGDIYIVSGGFIRRIAGFGRSAPADGMPALSAFFFNQGIKVDANGDLYAVDSDSNVVRKIILNSPTSFVSADGDKQSGQAGQSLPKPLKVQLNGRAGFGVAGVSVTFTVTSGDATLTAATTTTDASGAAGVGVTLGKPGSVVITATAVGTGMAPVQFSVSAVLACPVVPPVVSSVNSASDFGGSSSISPGSWLEIKGTNLAQTSRLWTGSDFNGSSAPTAVDGVSVTVNGKPAFVEYVSPGQINVQAPADTATGPVPVVVTTASNSACVSAPVTVPEVAVNPGMLAPASFNIGGRQYLVALFADRAFVGKPNLIPGVAFRPAAPGDSITAYGIGFGDVVPLSPPGVVVAGTDAVPNLTITFGTAQAAISYAGLAPGTVGEYQFTFTVPNVPDGDYLVNFQAGSAKVAQTLYLTVQSPAPQRPLAARGPE